MCWGLGDHSVTIQGRTFSYIPTVHPGQRQLNGIHHFAFGSEALLEQHQNVINRVPLQRTTEAAPSRQLELNVKKPVVTELFKLLRAINGYAKVLRESNGMFC